MFQNSKSRGKKGGRPCRPQRVVIQIRERVGGRIGQTKTITVDASFDSIYFTLLQMFEKESRKYRRYSDDPRWRGTSDKPGPQQEENLQL